MRFGNSWNSFHCLWISILVSGCSSSRVEMNSPQKAYASSPADTAILVVAPTTIGRFETFQVFREEPSIVSIIGKAEYRLRYMDINTVEFPKAEFAAVKAGFARGVNLDDSEWVALSERLGGGKAVIYVLGFELSRARPTAIRVQDGIYNFTIAPIHFLMNLGMIAHGHRYTPFADVARNTLIYTHEVSVRVYRPKERALSPEARSRCIVQTKEGYMNRTSIGDVEEHHLKELFRKLF